MAKTRKIPAYCHHKAKDLAYVTLPIDGKRKVVYLGPYNSRESLEEYDRVISDWLGKRPVAEQNTGPTVRDLAERFQSYREPLLKDHQRYDLAAAVRLLVEHFGDRPASEFDAMLLDRFKSELAKRYSREYGNRILSYTKKAFKWALQRDLIPADNWVKIDTVEPLTAAEASTKDVEPIDWETVEATLPELSEEMQEMIRFIRWTGCRPGEARTARVGDVDRDNWLLELKKHKTAHKGKVRFVAIPADVREMVLPRLLRPADAHLFSATEDHSRPFEKRALGRAIDRAIKRINRERAAADELPIPHWHPYQLRHARATEVREKFGAEVCQVLLGHSKIDMSQHYAGLTKAKAVELSKQLG